MKNAKEEIDGGKGIKKKKVFVIEMLLQRQDAGEGEREIDRKTYRQEDKKKDRKRDEVRYRKRPERDKRKKDKVKER